MRAIAWRAWLIAEMLLVFVGGPVLLARLVYERHISLFAILPIVFAGLAVLLLALGGRDLRASLARLPGWRTVLSILALFILCGGALTLFAYERYPQWFLTFPRNNTRLWLLVMAFYPLVSVTAQELAYRVLFFHRYARALNGTGWLAIAVNAALFAGMHAVLFPSRGPHFHWEAVALSFAGGLLFAYRFTRTRSFLAAALEHALYGDLIFTIGLGRFFFTGVSNL